MNGTPYTYGYVRAAARYEIKWDIPNIGNQFGFIVQHVRIRSKAFGQARAFLGLNLESLNLGGPCSAYPLPAFEKDYYEWWGVGVNATTGTAEIYAGGEVGKGVDVTDASFHDLFELLIFDLTGKFRAPHDTFGTATEEGWARFISVADPTNATMVKALRTWQPRAVPIAGKLNSSWNAPPGWTDAGAYKHGFKFSWVVCVSTDMKIDSHWNGQ